MHSSPAILQIYAIAKQVFIDARDCASNLFSLTDWSILLQGAMACWLYFNHPACTGAHIPVLHLLVKLEE